MSSEKKYLCRHLVVEAGHDTNVDGLIKASRLYKYGRMLFNIILTFFQSNQRLSSSPSSLPLTTPVVSITTPSLSHQSLVYSSINAAYNNGIS